jgi:hypothetical protein
VISFAGKLCDLYFRDGHAQVLLEANTGKVTVVKAPDQPRLPLEPEPVDTKPADKPWRFGMAPLEDHRRG